MNELLLTLLVSISLSGCFRNEYTEIQYSNKPPELRDCKFFYMTNDSLSGNKITVVRCPNSTTSTTITTTTGKFNKNSTIVVVDK